MAWAGLSEPRILVMIDLVMNKMVVESRTFGSSVGLLASQCSTASLSRRKVFQFAGKQSRDQESGTYPIKRRENVSYQYYIIVACLMISCVLVPVLSLRSFMLTNRSVVLGPSLPEPQKMAEESSAFVFVPLRCLCV